MSHKYFFKYLFVFSILYFCGSSWVFSQDTIRYYQDKKLVEEIYMGEKDDLPKSALLPRIAFGFQTLTPTPYPTGLLASRFWSIGGQYRRLLSQSQNISIGIGLEMSWNNLRWQDDKFLEKDPNGINFVNPNVEQIHKNKLGILNISVPAIFYKSFEKNWRVGIGVYTDWRLQSSSRTAYTTNNTDFDTKNFSDFHLQPVRYGVQFEAKYKLLRIFSKYDLNTLFRANKAEKTNLWTFGIGL